jgi:ribosome recycling factor
MARVWRRSTELAKLRTGRAHTVSSIASVSYYGNDVRLNQVASVAATDAPDRTPWEKNMVTAVDKRSANRLGANPITAGNVIRVPALTEERRRELVRLVHKEAEVPVAVRNAP